MQRLAALGAQVTRAQASEPALPSGEVVQRLMTATAFAAGRAGVKSKKLDAIHGLLATYAQTWGYPTGFGEYNGKYYRQERLRLLNDIEHQVHAYFRDSGTARIADAPASALMLGLLDDAQAEHEKQIRVLTSHSSELPVDDRTLSKDDKGKVRDNWQSIVGETGNLRITETQNDKGSGLTRSHAGFRTKALSSVARLLQEPHGRDLIGSANKGGGDAGRHITIAPVGKAAHVVKPGWFSGTGGTIAPGGWAAEALDQKKNALKSGKGLADKEIRDLDRSGDPLADFENAARRHRSRAPLSGVKLGGKKYAFNQGTGSRVDYISDHRDSENRVVTRGVGGAWREGLSPTSVTLGHEIGHAVRNRQGANIDGGRDLQALTGIPQDERGQWSDNDEELVNIRQVENKLLVEKSLDPRDFHKDYHGAIEEALTVRGLKYHNFAGHSPGVFTAWQTAMGQRNFPQADTVLTQVGY
ncbi:MAG: hypothetical protein JWM65_1256 [Sphingomonas bacterium]|nr:hypothetical protein [Sphingomonas bacterium]